MSFTELGLSAPLLSALSKQGYTDPTPVQKQAIPFVLEGKDVLAAAQTGTGKTAAFTLPMLELLSRKKVNGPKKVRGLILTPTRELADQVQSSVRTYGSGLPFKSTAIFGGMPYPKQISALRQKPQIIVATPGRLLDHAKQNHLDLSEVEFLVLDEADRMLDMGFIHDITKILKMLPENRQSMMFSATFSSEIKKLADGFLKSPVMIEIDRGSRAADTVKQSVHPVNREQKRELLSHMIRDNGWKQVLVFTRTKNSANRLADQLSDDKIRTDSIHGNKSQNARMKALANFKQGKVQVLVATDIAARGIDIDYLPHVINFELPHVAEDYVHRIGRTGRAGRQGEAISLVCIDENHLLKKIERLLGREIKKDVIEGYAPDPKVRAQPIRNGQSASFKGRGSRRPPATQMPGKKKWDRTGKREKAGRK